MPLEQERGRHGKTNDFGKCNTAVGPIARMAKLADAADLKSAGPYRPWGFKSPSGHQICNPP